jgi:hypothetical protein
MKRRATISFARFVLLRAGDLVVWRGCRLRTVQEGPFDKLRGLMPKAKGHAHLTFSISYRSWTNRVSTVYNYNDLKHLIKPANKRVRGLALKSEIELLKNAGFDIRKGLQRDLKDFGKPGCRAFERLAKGNQR